MPSPSKPFNYARTRNRGPRTSRSHQIRDLLMEGKSPPEVAALVGVSRRYVFQFALHHRLPTNRPIPQGSPRERQILAAHTSGWSLSDLAASTNSSVAHITSILSRATRPFARRTVNRSSFPTPVAS